MFPDQLNILEYGPALSTYKLGKDGRVVKTDAPAEIIGRDYDPKSTRTKPRDLGHGKRLTVKNHSFVAARDGEGLARARDAKY